MRSRLRPLLFIGLHLLVSAVVAAAFAWQFARNWRAVAAHVLLLAEWDLTLLSVVSALGAFSSNECANWPRLAYRLLLAATCTLQMYLYALNAVSNVSWGLNMTGHLVTAFFPTVWSGKEAFPVGAAGIILFAGGTLIVLTAAFCWRGPALPATTRGGHIRRLRLVA